MTLLAAQYLERSGFEITPQAARDRLRRAFEILPFNTILLGWEVLPSIEEAVASECARFGAKLYRWHPLLTSSSHTPIQMRTINRYGQPISGFHDMPEFTFLCPNRPEVQEICIEEIDRIIQHGLFQGLFLDRIRFPSPSTSPSEHLACFCDHCRLVARAEGLDLEETSSYISEILSKPNGRMELIRQLFEHNENNRHIEAFLAFRSASITRMVKFISTHLATGGLDTALDCFSPSLTRLVGQDLRELNDLSIWIKIMTYPRTYGPAGLPFELLGLLDWMDVEGKSDSCKALREICRVKIPDTRAELSQVGLQSKAISQEIALARQTGVKRLLAGLALVDLLGVNDINLEQARSDIQASLEADGLVLSWDLWFIPDMLLEMISREQNY